MTSNGEPTASTRVAARPETRTAQAVPADARRLEPRPYTGEPVARRRAAQQPARPRRRRGRAFALFLLLLLVIAAVAVAIVVSTSTAPTVVHARNIIAHDFQSAYNQLTSLVTQYTK